MTRARKDWDKQSLPEMLETRACRLAEKIIPGTFKDGAQVGFAEWGNVHADNAALAADLFAVARGLRGCGL